MGNMPDWRKEIRRSLEASNLDPAKEMEIVEELNQHLSDRYEELLAAGDSPEQATAIVLKEWNGEKLTAELSEVIAGEPPAAIGHDTDFLGGVAKDLRHGARLLRLNPGFAIVAVLSLMLGIGANTAIFQLIDAVRLRTLPVKHPEQLALVKIVKAPNGRTGGFHGDTPHLTYAIWESLRERQQAFSQIAAWNSTIMNLNQGGEARRARVLFISGSYFETLGVKPQSGRLISATDDQPSCSGSGAVISDAFWHREYGAGQVLGRKITLDGQPFEIIGITQASFFGVEIGRNFDVAIPICSEAIFSTDYPMISGRLEWWLASIGRLKPGWTLDRASAQLSAVSSGIFADTLPPEYDAIDKKNYLAFELGALPAGTGVNSLSKEYESPLWLLMGISGVVLLIACANLANLMIARAGAREREMAVRMALGASRSRLMRQLLAESLLLVAIGAMGGVLLAQLLSRTLVSFLNTQEVSLFLELQPDWRMFAFTTALAVFTCLLFGLAPAIYASRTSPGEVMKAGSRGITMGRERFGFRRALVISQVALSLVLLVGALLFVRTFRNLLQQDAGFRQNGILITYVDFTNVRIPEENRVAYKRDLLERTRAIPGVLSAADVAIVPMGGGGWNENISIPSAGMKRKVANFNQVSPGYFQTVGTTLISGRDFNDHDTPQSPLVSIVTETFCRKFLNGGNPVGLTLAVAQQGGKPDLVYRIVGLVKDTKYYALRDEFTPIVFVSGTQDAHPDTQASLMIRTDQISSAVVSLKGVMAQINPAIVLKFRVFETLIRDGLLRERLMAALSGFFAFLATVLSMIGLYGVISFMVVRRRNEIGIRMALGADGRLILKMILREAASLLSAGLAIGAVLALAAGTAARALLYGLRPSDPLTLVMAVGGIAAVAMLASYLPAHRAASVDPMQALREE